jgi:hypothetical protein
MKMMCGWIFALHMKEYMSFKSVADKNGNRLDEALHLQNSKRVKRMFHLLRAE